MTSKARLDKRCAALHHSTPLYSPPSTLCAALHRLATRIAYTQRCALLIRRVRIAACFPLLLLLFPLALSPCFPPLLLLLLISMPHNVKIEAALEALTQKFHQQKKTKAGNNATHPQLHVALEADSSSRRIRGGAAAGEAQAAQGYGVTISLAGIGESANWA